LFLSVRRIYTPASWRTPDGKRAEQHLAGDTARDDGERVGRSLGGGQLITRRAVQPEGAELFRGHRAAEGTTRQLARYPTAQVTAQVTEHVVTLVKLLDGELTRTELQDAAGSGDRQLFPEWKRFIGRKP